MFAASTFPNPTVGSGAKLSFQPIKWLTGGGKYRRLKIVEICQDFFNLTDHACRNGTYMVHCPNRPAIWCIHLDFRVPPGLGHPKQQEIAVSATSTCRSTLSVNVIHQQFGGALETCFKKMLQLKKTGKKRDESTGLQYTAMPRP